VIRVVRGDEPPEVRAQREHYLPLAIAACREHGLKAQAFKKTIAHYDAGKLVLFFRQHEKCAYCERKPGLLNQPLEHFRPKLEAKRHLPPGKDEGKGENLTDGYWWLTWTWDNQFFACETCNGGATKGSYFPLERGASLPLPDCTRDGGGIPEESCDLAAESPMLLDPADPEVDPMDHLQWQPANRQLPLRLWRWSLHTPTDRGYWTSRILLLDALTNEVNDRYSQTVWPRFEADVLRQRNSPTSARNEWRALGESLLTPSNSFAAATWWQFEALRCHTPHLPLQLPRLPRPHPR
jgi:hypothetical protein